jgi:nucleoside-diphosphate-sugar epimerase
MRVFVTGATGFIGRVVLDEMLAAGFESIVCLTRDPDRLREVTATSSSVRCVPADLATPAQYAEALSGSDMVVHLAAATGSARESELMRVNVEGTRLLVDACNSRGVRGFLHVSSIAAGYSDLGGYPYGRSKREAEGLVQASGLAFTILRPTIVLGEGSPVWRMLRKLATLPVVPVFDGGTVRVQPVDVRDVARAIVAIVGGFRCDTPVVELGGPDVVSWVELLMRIRAACGLRPTRAVAIPAWLVREPLRAAGWALRGAFPISPGQVSPFLMDGTAEPSSLHRHLEASMASLDVMLGRLARES